MKLQKWTALLLALVLCFALAACSGSAATTPTPAPTQSAPAATTPAADDDWSYIKGNGKIVIGITVYEPMNYYNEKNELVGFDTEFAKAVCAKLGIEPEFVEINWDTKEVELAAKNIDCIWNGLTVTEERKENMSFSESYIKNMQSVVIQKANESKFTDAASLSKADLVAEVSSAGEAAIIDDAVLSGAKYVGVAKQTDALLEVKAGTADAAVLDYVLAKSMVGEGTDYSDLMMIKGLDLAAEEYAIGFRVDSTAVPIVNAAIDELIADGTLNTIAETYGLENQLIANQK